jgi:hypothetical protein
LRGAEANLFGRGESAKLQRLKNIRVSYPVGTAGISRLLFPDCQNPELGDSGNAPLDFPGEVRSLSQLDRPLAESNFHNGVKQPK